jgi:hypothetical protein
MVDLSQVTPQKEALKLVPVAMCDAHGMVPIRVEETKGRTLVLAMADPLNLAVLEEVAFTSGCKVKPVLAGVTAIGQAIAAWHRGSSVPISSAAYEAPVVAKTRAIAQGEAVILVQQRGEERVLPQDPPAPSTAASLPPLARGEPILSGPHLPHAPAAPWTAPAASAAALARQADPTEELEKKFWALMRVLARKGLLSKEEFLQALQDTERI